MGDGAALLVVLIEVQDVEVQWEYSLWKVAEILVLEGLPFATLHLTKCSLQVTHPVEEGVRCHC